MKREKSEKEMQSDCDDVWSTLETKPHELTPEVKEHVAELAIVPTTQRGPLIWRKDDDEAFGAGTPEPLGQHESQRRVDSILENCKRIRTQNRRADFFYYKELHGFRLLEFDRLGEDSQRAVLDRRYATCSDAAYRRHRMDLHAQEKKAVRSVKRLRADLGTYLKLTSGATLCDDEREQCDAIYDWLLYNLQFDSMKWLTLPRSYNRKVILLEIAMKLFIETYFACSILDGDQIKSWFAKGLNHWRLLLEKQVIFIQLKNSMPITFWDLIYEEVQSLVSQTQKSVIFVASEDASQHIPNELKEEYRFACRPHNKTYLENMKIDRTTYQMQYVAPNRKA